MEFKNGYKLIYEKNKKLYASKEHIPHTGDSEVDLGLTQEQINSIKLVYEKDDNLVASTTGLPTEDPLAVNLTINGESVLGPSGEEPEPKFFQTVPLTWEEAAEYFNLKGKTGDRYNYPLFKFTNILKPLGENQFYATSNLEYDFRIGDQVTANTTDKIYFIEPDMPVARIKDDKTEVINNFFDSAWGKDTVNLYIVEQVVEEDSNDLYVIVDKMVGTLNSLMPVAFYLHVAGDEEGDFDILKNKITIKYGDEIVKNEWNDKAGDYLFFAKTPLYNQAKFISVVADSTEYTPLFLLNNNSWLSSLLNTSVTPNGFNSGHDSHDWKDEGLFIFNNKYVRVLDPASTATIYEGCRDKEAFVDQAVKPGAKFNCYYPFLVQKNEVPEDKDCILYARNQSTGTELAVTLQEDEGNRIWASKDNGTLNLAEGEPNSMILLTTELVDKYANDFTFEIAPVAFEDLSKEIKDLYFSGEGDRAGVPLFKITNLQSELDDVEYYIGESNLSLANATTISRTKETWYNTRIAECLWKFRENTLFEAAEALSGHRDRGLEDFNLKNGEKEFANNLFIYALKQIDEDTFKVAGKAWAQIYAHYPIKCPEFHGVPDEPPYTDTATFVKLVDGETGEEIDKKYYPHERSSFDPWFKNANYKHFYRFELGSDSTSTDYDLMPWSVYMRGENYETKNWWKLNLNTQAFCPEDFRKYGNSGVGSVAKFININQAKPLTLEGNVPFIIYQDGKVLNTQVAIADYAEDQGRLYLFIYKAEEDLRPNEAIVIKANLSIAEGSSYVLSYATYSTYYDCFIASIDGSALKDVESLNIECLQRELQKSIFKRDEESDFNFVLFRYIDKNLYETINEGQFLIESVDDNDRHVYVAALSAEEPLPDPFEISMNGIKLSESSWFMVPYQEDFTGVAEIKIAKREIPKRRIYNSENSLYTMYRYKGMQKISAAPGQYIELDQYDSSTSIFVEHDHVSAPLDVILNGEYNNRMLINEALPSTERPQEDNHYIVKVHWAMGFATEWYYYYLGEDGVTITILEGADRNKYIKNDITSTNDLTLIQTGAMASGTWTIAPGGRVAVNELSYMYQHVTQFRLAIERSTEGQTKQATISGKLITTECDNLPAQTYRTKILSDIYESTFAKMPQSSEHDIWESDWRVNNLGEGQVVTIKVSDQIKPAEYVYHKDSSSDMTFDLRTYPDMAYISEGASMTIDEYYRIETESNADFYVNGYLVQGHGSNKPSCVFKLTGKLIKPGSTDVFILVKRYSPKPTKEYIYTVGKDSEVYFNLYGSDSIPIKQGSNLSVGTTYMVTTNGDFIDLYINSKLIAENTTKINFKLTEDMSVDNKVVITAKRHKEEQTLSF